METAIEKNTVKLTDHTNEVLVNGIKHAIHTIDNVQVGTDWIQKNRENFNGDQKYLEFNVNELSKNQRKKLKNYVNGCVLKQTRTSINKFYHFLHKRVMKQTTPALFYGLSKREESIQIARKKYTAARDLAIMLHSEYMEIKGDYYKH